MPTLTRPTRAKTPGAPPSLEIRPATEADKRAAVEIVSSSASWYEPFIDPADMGEHRVDRRWADVNFRRREFFVARLEGETVGVLSIQEVNDDWLYLGYVYVHTDHVGRRVGGRLLRFAEREARRRGRRGMALIAHPEASWACRAYEKFGFDCIGAERDEVLAWEDGWLEPYYEEGFRLFRYEIAG